jgi:hypothetical protein
MSPSRTTVLTAIKLLHTAILGVSRRVHFDDPRFRLGKIGWIGLLM